MRQKIQYLTEQQSLKHYIQFLWLWLDQAQWAVQGAGAYISLHSPVLHTPPSQSQGAGRIFSAFQESQCCSLEGIVQGAWGWRGIRPVRPGRSVKGACRSWKVCIELVFGINQPWSKNQIYPEKHNINIICILAEVPSVARVKKFLQNFFLKGVTGYVRQLN